MKLGTVVLVGIRWFPCALLLVLNLGWDFGVKDLKRFMVENRYGKVCGNTT